MAVPQGNRDRRVADELETRRAPDAAKRGRMTLDEVEEMGFKMAI